MGCSQSDESSVINPVNQHQLVLKQSEMNKQKATLEKANNENKQTKAQTGKNQPMMKKTQNTVASSIQKYIKREQVNEMPNDEHHVKILQGAKQLVTQMKLPQAQKKADQFFQKGWIDQAIDIYQRIIVADPTYKNQIQGLGNILLSESYFQWYIYQWYSTNKQLKNIKSSPYDALSLCYALINPLPKYSTDIKKGQMWYKMMTAKYPENYGLWMGYGNILSMSTSFDQALKIYDKVLELKPNFINALVCKAMLHTYKRIILPKAIELANKILQLTGSNCYAWQVLGRANTNIDTKIQYLKKGAQKHPEYVRTINQIGICYGGTKKDYDQAIKWYKKCIQISPCYYSCYNNIGVNLQLKKQLKQAKQWYFKAIQINPEYAAPHNNLIDVYNQLKKNDKQIQQQIIVNPKIKKQIFFWKLGVEFYYKKQLQRSRYWIQKATQIDSNHAMMWNSYGMTLDDLGQAKKAIQMYLKAIQINPQLYHAYFNAGIAYKALNMTDQAILMYQKATQVNPKYSYPYNNLGNIYKNRVIGNPDSKNYKDDLQQAVQYYQRAVQFNSTYTLALSNMGLCLAKLGKFKEAYNAFMRAKQALPNDNNNLTQSNKSFLKQQLDIFDKQGGKWKKTGSITDQQKQSLKNLILQFENKFKSIAQAQKKIQVSAQKMFNPQIIQIIKIINQDKFQLQKIQQIFEFVEKIFYQDQQYFHIIPLLIIQKFTNEVFHKKKAIMNVEDQLRDMMKRISQIVNKKQNQLNQMDIVKNIDVKLTECKATNRKVNLFQQISFFDSYQELYIQIARINNLSKQSFSQFSLLVEEVRKKSNGIPGGIGTKIPIKQSQQFKVMLRIMQKMFKKQIDKQRTIKIIKKIDQNLQKLPQAGLDTVVKEIMKGWTDEITQILKDRKNKTETEFTVSDLLRAKCSYNSLDDLLKAVRVCDSYCKTYGYEIIELDNRLSKPQTQDIVFKIKISNALCQFQLAMKQNQSLYHLDHCVYEILRSPLGCIFGSYLFMSKQVKYPLTANCKDITQKLDATDEQDKKIVKMCADYVFNGLKASFKAV